MLLHKQYREYRHKAIFHSNRVPLIKIRPITAQINTQKFISNFSSLLTRAGFMRIEKSPPQLPGPQLPAPCPQMPAPPLVFWVRFVPSAASSHGHPGRPPPPGFPCKRLPFSKGVCALGQDRSHTSGLSFPAGVEGNGEGRGGGGGELGREGEEAASTNLSLLERPSTGGDLERGGGLRERCRRRKRDPSPISRDTHLQGKERGRRGPQSRLEFSPCLCMCANRPGGGSPPWSDTGKDEKL